MSIRAGLISLFIKIYFISFAVAGTQPILFYSSYINSNSIYYYGMIIDSSGNISDYKFFQRNWPSSNLNLSSLLDTMLAVSTPTGKKVSTDTLNAVQELIKPASEGVVTSLPGCCCDVGSFRYSAVMYDSANDSLREIICFQSGEINICNSSDNAKAIARWLNSIDSVQGLTYSGMSQRYNPPKNQSDSLALLHLSECAPPDYFLYPSVAVLPLQPKTAANKQRSLQSSTIFNLNGQKAQKLTRQLLVGKEGKIPLNLKPEFPNRNRVR